MKIYDLFGRGAPGVEDAMEEVAAALQISLDPHYSDYWGGDYYSTGEPGAEHIRVLRNEPDEDPEEMPYMDLARYPVVVEVNDSPYADHYRELLTLAGYTHIRRKTRDS